MKIDENDIFVQQDEQFSPLNDKKDKHDVDIRREKYV